MDGSRIILAAHRGDKYKFPENTMPAFKSAADFGVDMIETDVRMSKDGFLVLMHDRSALRTAGADKNIDEMTLREIKTLDAGCTFSSPIKTEIPTAEEFLAFISNTNIMVNWEFKVYPRDFGSDAAFKIVDKLVFLLEKYNMTEKSMMNSFSIQVLEYIYKKYNFPIHGQGINSCRRSCDESEIPETELFDWCCLYPNKPGFKALDFKENFDYSLKNNIIPCLCIPDEFDDYKKAIDYGCKMFTSNNIYEAERILGELGTLRGVK